jgi:hypothetical protein
MLRFMVVTFVAIVLMACGKNGEKRTDAVPQSTEISISHTLTKAYSKEDGECFAGVMRAFDEKHMTSADYTNWVDKLNSKDKEWLSGITDFYSKAAAVAIPNILKSNKTPKQLYNSNLITMNQLNVLEGYLNVYQEGDSRKAGALSSNACIKVGFTKKIDLS